MKNKKLLIGLAIIAAVAAIVVGSTIAYFNDTETSSGNIFTSGSVDLKVDHLKETYNGVDCKTCSVTVISDPTNMVIEKNGSPITPYNAVYAWVHSAWTAQNDSELVAANAKWIWEANPTKQEDTLTNVTYTFKKDFEWYGPIVSTDLYMAVGSDNSVEVYLNGTLIGSNYGEYGYKQGSMLIIPAGNITPYILQGNNVLKFVVKNWALAGSTPYTNPAGLIYKFSIDGNCGDDYFKSHCQLWGEKDLTNEHFWNFDDVKPGDNGKNLISLHVYDNDSWACMMVNNKQDIEHDLVDSEAKAGDITANMGELSQFINVFGWEDDNQDGIYQISENTLFQGSLADPIVSMAIADSNNTPQITGNTTKYIGLAWCFGAQTVNGSTGEITCNGSGVGNIAQTDEFIADLTIYATQYRNQPNFTCASLSPNQLINGGFEDGTTGWNVTGYASVVKSYNTYNPTEGNNFLMLTAGLGNGVDTIASQQVTLNAGEKIQGDAAFLGADYLPFNDDAAVVVVSGSPLATPWSKDIATVGNYGSTPWQHWSWTAPSSGVYTLELKVRNIGDNILNSSALFDANVVTN